MVIILPADLLILNFYVTKQPAVFQTRWHRFWKSIYKYMGVTASYETIAQDDLITGIAFWDTTIS